MAESVASLGRRAKWTDEPAKNTRDLRIASGVGWGEEGNRSICRSARPPPANYKVQLVRLAEGLSVELAHPQIGSSKMLSMLNENTHTLRGTVGTNILNPRCADGVPDELVRNGVRVPSQVLEHHMSGRGRGTGGTSGGAATLIAAHRIG